MAASCGSTIRKLLINGTPKQRGIPLLPFYAPLCNFQAIGKIIGISTFHKNLRYLRYLYYINKYCKNQFRKIPFAIAVVGLLFTSGLSLSSDGFLLFPILHLLYKISSSVSNFFLPLHADKREAVTFFGVYPACGGKLLSNPAVRKSQSDIPSISRINNHPFHRSSGAYNWLHRPLQQALFS